MPRRPLTVRRPGGQKPDNSRVRRSRANAALTEREYDEDPQDRRIRPSVTAQTLAFRLRTSPSRSMALGVCNGKPARHLYTGKRLVHTVQPFSLIRIQKADVKRNGAAFYGPNQHGQRCKGRVNRGAPQQHRRGVTSSRYPNQQLCPYYCRRSRGGVLSVILKAEGGVLYVELETGCRGARQVQ